MEISFRSDTDERKVKVHVETKVEYRICWDELSLTSGKNRLKIQLGFKSFALLFLTYLF